MVARHTRPMGIWRRLRLRLVPQSSRSRTRMRTALFQVINQLNPVVIVDESHHATSTLSQEMLTNFNPAFILDLTATPKRQAKIDRVRNNILL